MVRRDSSIRRGGYFRWTRHTNTRRTVREDVWPRMRTASAVRPKPSKGRKAQMRSTILRGSIFFASAILLSLTMSAALLGQASDDQAGVAYVLTNRDTNNSIAVFHRSANGTLTAAEEVLTGGKGSGGGPDALRSQGSLRFSDSGDLLFAVNAGSNDVSVFRVTEKGLQLLQTVASE